MSTLQLDAISVKLEKLQRQITVSKRLIAFQSVVIAFMALVQLLK